MDKVTLFTSFNEKGYNEYGRQMLKTFDQYCGPGVKIIAYPEGFVPDYNSERIEYRDLIKASPQLDLFKQKYSKFELAHGIMRQKDGRLIYNYNLDAIKFSNKVYCITHALQNMPTQYAFWIDADTIAKKEMPVDFFLSYLSRGAYTCYLGRKHMHSECGFVGYDTSNPAHLTFVQTWEALFNNGDIFMFEAWHDCVSYDILRGEFERRGLIISNNISADVMESDHPFVNTSLGDYMDHLKGPERKKAGASFEADKLKTQTAARNGVISNAQQPVGINKGRYKQIVELIAKVKPKTILEIGTWNGYRAMEMAREALKHNERVTYYGYDLFEMATPDTDSEEMNVKPHYTKDNVARFLEEFKRANPGFDYVLTAGNTRETLPKIAVDFAFIDGGHSVETIQSDFNQVKGSKVILFDDYYEGGIDIEKYGCNKVVEKINHTVLPVADPVQGGGFTKLVVTGV